MTRAAVRLAPVALADVEALHAFETANRAYFEARINPRPPGYYAPGGVEQALRAALEDARMDRAYQFLVREERGAIVGRINLTNVTRGLAQEATLGYRIGEAHGGKGHASEALRLLLELAFGALDLRRIEAYASVFNVASQRVLLRNGFGERGRVPGTFALAGEWHDRLRFERLRDG